MNAFDAVTLKLNRRIIELEAQHTKDGVLIFQFVQCSLGLEADTTGHYLIPLVFSHERPTT